MSTFDTHLQNEADYVIDRLDRINCWYVKPDPQFTANHLSSAEVELLSRACLGNRRCLHVSHGAHECAAAQLLFSRGIIAARSRELTTFGIKVYRIVKGAVG